MTDFFISYTVADRSWGEWIAWELEEAGYTTFIQAWDFRPGGNFVLDMQRAATESVRTLLVLSPDYLKSGFSASEWAAAFAKDPTGEKGLVLPIRIKPCEPVGLLPQIVYIDLVGLDAETAKATLLAGVGRGRIKPSKSPAYPGLSVPALDKAPLFPGTMSATPRGKLINVPELPAHFLPRPEDLTLVKALVLTEIQEPIAVTGTTNRVGLHGMGGIGKSVLAAALARDEDIRGAFYDGVFWLTLGQEPEITERQAQLANALNEHPSNFTDAQQGKARLSELLSDAACFIILDDVWQITHMQAFDTLGPKSRLLITTRDLRLMTALGAREHRLDVLSESQALALLSLWAGQSVSALPGEAHLVAQECGYLPLALSMVGAMVRGKPERWGNALYRLRHSDLDKIQQQFPDYPYPDLLRAIQVSVEALDVEVKKRYLDFAVFPEDTAIAEAVLHTYWKAEGLDIYDVQDVVDTLVDRSLLRRDDAGNVTLHDLQYDYVRKQVGDLVAYHNRLLHGYTYQCLENWWNVSNDGYIFQHLCYHLKEAGKEESLKDLLLNFKWLQAKLEYCDIRLLINDYRELPNDTDLRLIRQSLELSGHVLIEHKNHLASQITGRLLSQPSLQIQNFLKNVQPSSVEILPRTCSLTPPGGPLHNTLTGHSGTVFCLSLTDNGKWAVSGSSDKTLKIWNLVTGQQQYTLSGHNGSVTSVKLTNDGRRVVSGSDDTTMRVWDLESGQHLFTLNGHNDTISCMALSSNDKWVVSGSDDFTLKVWDLETGKQLHTLRGHHDEIKCVEVTSDNKLAISGSSDKTLKVWDLETGQTLRTLRGHSAPVSGIVLTGDEKQVVSGSADCTLKTWNIKTGQQLQTFIGHNQSIRCVALSFNGKQIVSGSSDKTLKVWDLETGEQLHTLRGHDRSVFCVALTNNNNLAVSGSVDHTLKIWDLETGELVRTLNGHDDVVSCIASSKESKRVVSGSYDNTLKVWGFETDQHPDTINRHSRPITCVSLNKDNKRVVSVSYDKDLKVWDLESGKQLQTLRGHEGSVFCAAVTGNGKRAVTGSSDRTLKVWDLEIGQPLLTFEGHYDWISCVKLTGTGKRAVSGSYDSTLKVWDLEEGQHLKTLKGHNGPVTCVSLSRDEKYVVSGSYDKTMKVWDIETGCLMHTLTGHNHTVTCIALTDDGNKAVSGSDDHNLILWNIETAKPIHTLRGHNRSVRCVRLTGDGKRAVSGSDDHNLIVWDVETGKPIRALSGHNRSVGCVRLTDDGKRAVSGSDDRTLVVWNIENGTAIAKFFSEGRILDVCLDRESRIIISGDSVGGVHFLDLA